jgi:hypothetical protein
MCLRKSGTSRRLDVGWFDYVLFCFLIGLGCVALSLFPWSILCSLAVDLGR